MDWRDPSLWLEDPAARCGLMIARRSGKWTENNSLSSPGVQTRSARSCTVFVELYLISCRSFFPPSAPRVIKLKRVLLSCAGLSTYFFGKDTRAITLTHLGRSPTALLSEVRATVIKVKVFTSEGREPLDRPLWVIVYEQWLSHTDTDTRY